MALQAYTIHSHYEPLNDSIENETDGQEVQLERIQRSEKDWQLGGNKGRLPPKFVAAQLPVDEYGRYAPPVPGPYNAITRPVETGEQLKASAAEFYKSLERTGGPIPRTPVNKKTSSATPSTSQQKPTIPLNQTRPDWFSQSYSAAASGTSTPASETITDRLSREPPNGQTSRKRARVWIALGPSNRGYEMLASKGWKEGEGLGARAGLGMNQFLKEKEVLSSQTHSAPASIGGDVIDLTLSSDEEDVKFQDEDFDDVFRPASPSTRTENEVESDEEEHILASGGISLRTPLPTVLKSDRKGIGLSSTYTVLPSGIHIPTRRITHGEKAIAAHVYSMEQARRQRSRWGKGRNGFKRRQRAEAVQRQQLLAYMNG